MATFQIVAGDFGEGRTGQVLVGNLYRESAQGFNMPTDQGFRSEHILKGQIAILEVATEENLKRMSGAIGWGLVGGVAFGPLGALAGVLKGGNKKQITFVCQFKDGRRFLGQCDSKTYADVQAASFASPTKHPSLSAPIERSSEPVERVLRQTCAEGRHYACGYKDCSCNCHQEKPSFWKKHLPFLG